MPPVASLHLFRVPWARVPAAMARMGSQRRPVRATAGVTFAQLLGTGRGRTFTVRDADPLTWGLFTVWADGADLARFAGTSPLLAAWHADANAWRRYDLSVLRSRGRWAGREPFAGLDWSAADGWDGPVAAVTRARLRPARALRFWRAVPPVSADLHAVAGLRGAVGIGELPLGLQGTFSLWERAAALEAYAYGRAPHRGAIAATRRVAWYAEELFARFALVGEYGVGDGGLPTLAGHA